MTLEIIFILCLLIAALVAFIADWTSPDVVAIAAWCALIFIPINGSPILTIEEALSVFSNHAPITVAAMFILTAALERTGAIDSLTSLLASRIKKGYRVLLLSVGFLAMLLSAFINNTPVVAIFMPVLISLGRTFEIPSSKLLMPLSFFCIMGGTCTLIGTSTNILVSGIASQQYQLNPIGMFELASLGIPLCIIGSVYIFVLAPVLLPDRAGVSSILSPDQRRQFFCQVLVKKNSPLVGQKLLESALGKQGKDFRIVEVRREGRRVMAALDEIEVRAYDRVLISASVKHMVSLPQVEGITLATETQGELGVESLSTIQGAVIEGIISPNSSLIGKSIRQINFRQQYGMLILALHRQGQNLSSKFLDARLKVGDTLLMLGPAHAFAELAAGNDFLLLEDKLPHTYRKDKMWIPVIAIAGIVALATFEIVPIVAAAIAACLLVFVTDCLKSEEAYKTVDWRIILLIYGMLGVGLGMEKTGAAAYLSQVGVSALQAAVPEALLPIFTLSFLYLFTSILTEFLSNNATAVIMTPIAINFALSIGVDPRPFVVAICFAASAAFSTPIGYQTNAMIYGAGGYQFSDYLRFGMPMNILFWVVTSFLIPMIWPF
ncbi:MAG: SLC13 family permease [Verrucomicrobiales bacterium]